MLWSSISLNRTFERGTIWMKVKLYRRCRLSSVLVHKYKLYCISSISEFDFCSDNKRIILPRKIKDFHETPNNHIYVIICHENSSAKHIFQVMTHHITEHTKAILRLNDSYEHDWPNTMMYVHYKYSWLHRQFMEKALCQLWWDQTQTNYSL